VNNANFAEFERYHRQMLLPGFGLDGQQRLARAHAAVVGCGALGTNIADALARAGVGTLTIIDRDVVELTNLQRQVLFDEEDARAQVPKAAAAQKRLESINSQITINAHVEDISPRNAEHLLNGADIILDGLDNFETRYLLNDIAVATGRAYCYGGAVGTTGLAMTILPHGKARRSGAVASQAVSWPDENSTPCLRCMFPDPPPPGSTPTCDTAGVLGPVVALVAAMQSAAALKLLTDNLAALDRSLLSIELWDNELRRMDVAGARRDDCPCCGLGEFAYLERGAGSATTSLCGRNAVQISPAADHNGEPASIDLASLAQRLGAFGSFTVTQYLLRGEFTNERGKAGEPIELSLFPNGRAIFKGTSEPEVARSLYAKYLGA
jgi:molybdopterin/thiamine biosynthesis adenylyltransferase